MDGVLKFSKFYPLPRCLHPDAEVCAEAMHENRDKIERHQQAWRAQQDHYVKNYNSDGSFRYDGFWMGSWFVAKESVSTTAHAVKGVVVGVVEGVKVTAEMYNACVMSEKVAPGMGKHLSCGLETAWEGVKATAQAVPAIIKKTSDIDFTKASSEEIGQLYAEIFLTGLSIYTAGRAGLGVVRVGVATKRFFGSSDLGGPGSPALVTVGGEVRPISIIKTEVVIGFPHSIFMTTLGNGNQSGVQGASGRVSASQGFSDKNPIHAVLEIEGHLISPTSLAEMMNTLRTLTQRVKQEVQGRENPNPELQMQLALSHARTYYRFNEAHAPGSVLKTLEGRSLDCDGSALLGAILAEELGLPWRLVRQEDHMFLKIGEGPDSFYIENGRIRKSPMSITKSDWIELTPDQFNASLWSTAGDQLLRDAVKLRSDFGRANQRKALLQEAVSIYDRSIHLDPSDARVHFNRGMALKHLGNKEAAKAAFEKARELSPELFHRELPDGRVINPGMDWDSLFGELQP